MSDVYVGIILRAGVGVSDGAGMEVPVAVGTPGVRLAVGSGLYVAVKVAVGVGVSDGRGWRYLLPLEFPELRLR
jgi:hypothetical protein